jgi:hypothetical protein
VNADRLICDSDINGCYSTDSSDSWSLPFLVERWLQKSSKGSKPLELLEPFCGLPLLRSSSRLDPATATVWLRLDHSKLSALSAVSP